MAKKNVVKTFVLCDDTINDYGFNIDVAGIDLTRFSGNPTMLDSHIQSLKTIIGKWRNLRIENGKLLADTDFWMSKDGVEIIADGVEQDYIVAVSIGFAYLESDMVQNPDGSWTLKKCELYECSFVAIGSNKNAVRLYSKTKEKWLEGDELTLALSSIMTTETKKTDIEKMAKISLTLATANKLNLSSQEVEQKDLDDAIEKLTDKHAKELKEEKDKASALQTKLEAFEDEAKKNKEALAEKLVNDAVVAGKLTASNKEDFKKMAIDNFALASGVLAGMQARNSLKGLGSGGGEKTDLNEDECFDYLQKHDTAKLASIKANEPEKYKELVSEYAKGKRYKK